MKRGILFGMIWIGFLSGRTQPAKGVFENAFLRNGAYSKNFSDAFSFGSNAACLGSQQKICIGAMTLRKWMLKELDEYTVSTAFFMGHGGVGLSLSQTGDISYNEQQVDLAYGKKLGKLELGIRLNYVQASALGYATEGVFSAGLAFRVHLTESMIVGCEMDMPADGHADKPAFENGSRIFRMGLGYELPSNLLLTCQIIKAGTNPVNMMAALDYRYQDRFLFSFGINSDAGSPFFKSGWTKNQLGLLFFVTYQPVLGFSPGLQILWEAKNKKK